MSWFNDDFYSTKVSRQTKQRSKADRPFYGRRSVTIMWMAGCFMIGVLLTLAVITQTGQRSTSEAAFSDTMTAGTHVQLAYQDQIIQATGKAQPSVVSVISRAQDKALERPIDIALGSGIIFHKEDKKVMVVTNHHVIENAETIEVVLFNGKSIKAELIGTDVLTDLSVLAIEGKGIEQVADLGSSQQLQAGETAIAIGNPLGLGFSTTITVGVISAPHRLIDVSSTGMDNWKMEVIQTDAAINQGNSGGALVNLNGEVIGINSMKVLDMGVEGLGFAIPIDDVKPIVAELMQHGKVRRPYLGIYTANVSEFANPAELKLPDHVNNGIIVLEAAGPAQKAGLQTDDIIVALDQVTVNNTYELRKYLYEHKQIGDEVTITYYREGRKRTDEVKLTEWVPE